MLPDTQPVRGKRTLGRAATACVAAGLVTITSIAPARAATNYPNPAVNTASCAGGMIAEVPVGLHAAQELVPRKYADQLELTSDGSAKLVFGTKFCDYDATSFSPAVQDVSEVHLYIKLTEGRLYDGLRNFLASEDPQFNAGFKVMQDLDPTTTKPKAMTVGTAWGSHSGSVVEKGDGTGFQWTEVGAQRYPTPVAADVSRTILYEGDKGGDSVDSVHQVYSFEGQGVVSLRVDPGSVLSGLVDAGPVYAGAAFVQTENLTTSVQRDD